MDVRYLRKTLRSVQPASVVNQVFVRAYNTKLKTEFNG
jgi:hypothetical protein